MGKFRTYFLVFSMLLIAGITAYNFLIPIEHIHTIKTFSSGDAPDYMLVAASLAKTGKYGHLKASVAEIFNDLNQGDFKNKEYYFGGYSTWRPPVWPFFLAMFFTLFKYGLFAAHLGKFSLILLGAFVFFKTLRTYGIDKFWSILGGCIYLIHPTIQLYSRTFLSESMTYVVMTFLLYALVLIDKQPKIKNYIFLGLSSGFLILAHPYYLFLPFVLFLALWWKSPSQFNRLVISGIICVCMVSSWVGRNKWVYPEQGLFITSSTGAVMAKGWNEDVIKLHNNVTGDLANEGLVLQANDRLYELNEIERSSLYQQRTWGFIQSNFRLIPGIIGVKLKSAFNPMREGQKPGVLQSANEFMRILALLALVFALVFKRKKLVFVLGLSIIISTTLITIITYSGLRFRAGQAPMELFLIMVVFREIWPLIQSRITLIKSESR